MQQWKSERWAFLLPYAGYNSAAKGALDKLTYLDLGSNKIGDAGLQAFADALGKGALDKIKSIRLFGNPGNSALVENALERRRTRHRKVSKG